jgi:hypothetical protein
MRVQGRASLAQACKRCWAALRWRRGSANRRAPSRRPAVEVLDDRCVPSGFPVHRNITTTTWFYVGEPADASNGLIANAASA